MLISRPPASVCLQLEEALAEVRSLLDSEGGLIGRKPHRLSGTYNRHAKAKIAQKEAAEEVRLEAEIEAHEERMIHAAAVVHVDGEGGSGLGGSSRSGSSPRVMHPHEEPAHVPQHVAVEQAPHSNSPTREGLMNIIQEQQQLEDGNGSGARGNDEHHNHV